MQIQIHKVYASIWNLASNYFLQMFWGDLEIFSVSVVLNPFSCSSFAFISFFQAITVNGNSRQFGTRWANISEMYDLLQMVGFTTEYSYNIFQG